MADVKIQRGKHEGSQEERGMERHRAGTPARMGDWWTQDLFTMNPFALMRRMQEEMDRAFASSLGLWRGRGGRPRRWRSRAPQCRPVGMLKRRPGDCRRPSRAGFRTPRAWPGSCPA